MTIDLRSRQQPLKERYRADVATARLVHSVHSIPMLDDPTRVRISSGTTTWEIAAHPMAGGPEGVACSGDVLWRRWPVARRSPSRWSPPQWAWCSTICA